MRTQTVAVSCDLCGYGGAYTAAEDFTQHGPTGDVDLCRWCSRDPGPLAAGARMACGRHEITFAEDWSWSCSCGQRWVPWMYVKQPGGAPTPTRVVAAVPNLRYALARIHSEEA